jgi:hypothetical protein
MHIDIDIFYIGHGTSYFLHRDMNKYAYIHIGSINLFVWLLMSSEREKDSEGERGKIKDAKFGHM